MFVIPALPDDIMLIEMVHAAAGVIAEETVQPRAEVVLALKQMLRDGAEETNRHPLEVAVSGLCNLVNKVTNGETADAGDFLDGELEPVTPEVVN